MSPRVTTMALLLGAALAWSAAAWAQEPIVRPVPVRPSDEEAQARDEEQEPVEARGGARPVVLGGVEGEVAAGKRSSRFMAAVQAVFAEEEFRAERGPDKSGNWKSAGFVRNRFRLHEGDEAKDAWWVSLVADSLHKPPTGLAGVRLLIAVLTPQQSKLNARPQPIREELVFDPAKMKLDYVSAAGRVAALRALERMHQLDGELDEHSRLAWPGRPAGFAKPGTVE